MIDLHTHLEGSFPRENLYALVSKYTNLNAQDARLAVDSKLSVSNFSDFLSAWYWKNKLIRSLDDITIIAEGFAQQQIDEGVKYVDLFISPSDFNELCDNPEDYFWAINEGLNKYPACEINIIVDLVRNHGPQSARTTYDALSNIEAERILGFGLGGDENSYPIDAFADLFIQAKKDGYFTSIHSGEVGDAKSVMRTIDLISPHRLGHAITAAYSSDALNMIKERRTIVECAISSNFMLGLVDSYEEHPVKVFNREKIPFVLGTDDSLFFSTSIEREYRLCERICNLDDLGMKELNLRQENFSAKRLLSDDK